MTKKESAKRGYMTEGEILSHLKKFEYDGRIGYELPINYLKRILKKEKLLSEKTRLNVYSTLGDLCYAEGDSNTAMKWYSKADAHIDTPEKAERAYKESGHIRHQIRGMMIARKSIESKLTPKNTPIQVITFTTIILLVGIFFLSNKITGNIIGLNTTLSNWIGGALFIIGLIGAFTYFRKG